MSVFEIVLAIALNVVAEVIVLFIFTETPIEKKLKRFLRGGHRK